MIFLDSDIISYYFAGKAVIRDKLLQALDDGEELAVTAINVYEALKGYRYRRSYKKEAEYLDFVSTLSIHFLDDAVISEAADIYAGLRQDGVTIGDADILIAATVITCKGILISNNTKHYEYIDKLVLHNWL